MTDAEGFDKLRTAYDQLCTSYHAIDDFRAKLLGFLPLVTGGGLILLTGRADEVRKEFFGPVGLFGVAVTTGLLAYELFGIKKCHALLQAGVDLEEEMRLPAGQFTRRPNNLLGVVNEPFAAAAIYPAALAAWAYLALFFDPHERGKVISPTIFAVGFAAILLYDFSLRKPGFFLFSYPRRWRTSLVLWLRRRFQRHEPSAGEITRTAPASSSANSSSTRPARITTSGNPMDESQGNPRPSRTME